MPAHLRFIPLVMSVGVALTACTSAATPAPTAAPVVTNAPTATPTTDGTLPKPELASIKLGSPIGQFSQFPGTLAEQLGLYEKYGIKVTETKFNAGGDAVSALLSGAVDVASDAGVEVSINSQLTDTPAVSFAVGKIGVFDGFFCQANIKTAADVKGKGVGISTFGSAGDGSARLALKALGLTAADVTITPIGGSSARQAALKAGSLACAPIGIDQKDVELKLGLNMLVDLSKDKTLEWPAPGISVTNAFYKKYPNTVLVMVAASLEAMSVILHDRTTTVAEWSKFSQTDLATAGKTYDAALEQMNGDMTFTGSSFAFAQSVLAVVTPSLTTIDITKSYDGSLLKKLNDIGFYKKIGIPFPTKPWP